MGVGCKGERAVRGNGLLVGVGRGPAAGVLSDDCDHPLDRPEDRAVDHHLRPPVLRIGAAAGAKKNTPKDMSAPS